MVPVTFLAMDPDRGTDPTPLSIEALAASVEVQVSVTDPPPSGKTIGSAPNVPVGAQTGATTVTVSA